MLKVLRFPNKKQYQIISKIERIWKKNPLVLQQFNSSLTRSEKRDNWIQQIRFKKKKINQTATLIIKQKIYIERERNNINLKLETPKDFL